MDTQPTSPVPAYVIPDAKVGILLQLARILRHQRKSNVVWVGGEMVVTLDNGTVLIVNQENKLQIKEKEL